MYCDRQPQHEGGITGAAGGRRRRRWRKEVLLVEVFKDREEGSARLFAIAAGTNTSL